MSVNFQEESTLVQPLTSMDGQFVYLTLQPTPKHVFSLQVQSWTEQLVDDAESHEPAPRVFSLSRPYQPHAGVCMCVCV